MALLQRQLHALSGRRLLEAIGNTFGRDLIWSHPAFANRCVYARNDKELVCVALAASELK